MAELTSTELLDILKNFGDELRHDLDQRFDAIDLQLASINRDMAEIKGMAKLLDTKTTSHDRKFEKNGRAVYDIE